MTPMPCIKPLTSQNTCTLSLNTSHLRRFMHPYTLIHASITFGLGQAKSKMRSHTHPHKHGHTFVPTLTLHPSPSRPPPTLSMTPTRSSTNINTHPCIPSLILSRLAWGRHGQGHPTTFSSLVSFLP
ncbi:hypothetical protein PIB30_099025 [Stylosanthes scabra]|uniref:Uncharacterized protein n=1 Tax=Stylosanthes scabra TaxID=79078 RepID=A0ABU6WUY3_9FABA|nr:hypothetical protein [Stylosanthes scabra]